MSSNTSVIFDGQLSIQDNRGSLVNILAWFLLIASSLTVFTRIATKWLVSRKFNLDDGMILLSLSLSVGQTVATCLEVHYGLGQHIESLSAQQIISFQKAVYTSEILWLGSQCFSKLSVGLFIREISFNGKSTLGIVASTITWCAISIIVLIFQCHVPQVWDFLGNSCINREVFWDFINTFNILLDSSLVLLPLAVVWNLQVSMQRKIVIVGCFGSRILAIAAVVFQMVVSNQRDHSPDATFDFWLIALSMSLSECLAIVTACIPYLKPFLDGLESGMIRSDLLRRGDGTASQAAKYGYGSHFSKERKSPHSSANKSVLHNNQLELDSIKTNRPSTTVASVMASGNQDGIEWDAGSHSSTTQIIRQVKTWGVMSSEISEGQSSEERTM